MSCYEGDITLPSAEVSSSALTPFQNNIIVLGALANVLLAVLFIFPLKSHKRGS